MKNIRCEVLIALAILLLVISVPFLQVQMVAAKKHHSDDESSDVSSDDQSNDQQSSDQDSGPSLTDKICNALHNGAGGALLTLLPLAHIASGGTTAAAIAAAELYCSGR
jgi:hypothetical protein